MPRPIPRSVTPIIAKIRNFFLGKRYNEGNRFEMDQAKRSAPPPRLPVGPYHRLFKNAYHGRDARRLVRPPEVVYNVSGRKVLTNAKVKNDGRYKTPAALWVPTKYPVS